jgi:hypothetical protein
MFLAGDVFVVACNKLAHGAEVEHAHEWGDHRVTWTATTTNAPPRPEPPRPDPGDPYGDPMWGETMRSFDAWWERRFGRRRRGDYRGPV